MKKNFVVLIFLLTGCGGSAYKNRQLAQTHFSQASLEVTRYHEKNDSNALRKALNEVEQALAINQTAQAQGLKATILFQLGKLDESKELFELLLKNKTLSKAKRADATNNYAIVLYQLGHTQEAEETWKKLIDNPNYTSPELLYFNLGYAQLNEAVTARAKQEPAQEKAHLETAVDHFKNALSISKEYINAFFFMGQAYIGLKNLEEARNCYQTILTINPDHQTAAQVLHYIEDELVKHPSTLRQAQGSG